MSLNKNYITYHVSYSLSMRFSHKCIRNRVVLHAATKRGYSVLINASSYITTTCCLMPTHHFMQKRFMRRATAPSFVRSAFYIMDTLFKEDITSHIKNNKQYLAQKLVDLSLDHDKGIIQDKSIILTRMLTNQFDPYDIYNYYSKITGISVACASSKLSLVDPRIFSELPTLLEYHNHFGSDIVRTTANLDSMHFNAPGLKQPCPDFQMNALLKTPALPFENSLITYIANNPCKTLIHDEKSIGGMFEHSTSGSLGILPYDSHGNSLILNKTMTNLNQLLMHNKRNLHSIRTGVIHDRLDVNMFEPIFKQAAEILLNKGDYPVNIIHKQYQQFMWTNLQLDFKYNRTLSYIFPKEIRFTPLKEHALSFESRFCNLLKDRSYDLNKQGDYCEVCNAMLRAYKETCNPKLRPLLEYYIHNKSELHFNDKFIHNLAYFIKNDPWFQF